MTAGLQARAVAFCMSPARALSVPSTWRLQGRPAYGCISNVAKDPAIFGASACTTLVCRVHTRAARP
jgi:hypothetical protein